VRISWAAVGQLDALLHRGLCGSASARASAEVGQVEGEGGEVLAVVSCSSRARWRRSTSRTCSRGLRAGASPLPPVARRHIAGHHNTWDPPLLV